MGIIKLLRNTFIGLLILAIFLLVSCSNPSSNENKANKQSLQSGHTQEAKKNISQASTGNPASSDIITDIVNWNHPVKDVLNKYNIKIKKVELLNNKEYPVFNVEFDPIYKLDSQGAKYFDTLLKKIASANGYWNFKVVDDKSKFVFDVDCDKEKKNVIDIVVNGKKGLLKEMIDYNNQMVNNWDKATEYLTTAVPEIKQFEKQISKDSNEKVTLAMRLDGVPDKYSDSQYKDFYCIYIGENHPDHTVRWNSFYVNKDLNRIMVEDILTGDLITLEQWRKKNTSKENNIN